MSQLRCLAVVPLRSFRHGKSRLAIALDSGARESLTRAMATRVITTALTVVPTAVVSADHEVLLYAKELGAMTIAETVTETENHRRLNSALHQAAHWAQEHDYLAQAVIAADLPLISHNDVVALTRLETSKQLFIATDRNGRGTNAITQSPPAGIGYRFGTDSLRNHQRAGYAAHFNVTVLDRPGLSFDVDTPDDFAQLQARSDP